MTTHPQVPDGPIDRPPNGYVPEPEQRQALLDELAAANIALGEYDERIVAWVAGWDWMTVATIASWIKRARTDN